MIRRPGLSLKILLVAFLNVALLFAVFYVFARYQYRLDLGSALLAPARYQMLSISRLAALELNNTSRDHWGDILTQNAATYPADFFLFDRDGNQIAGKSVDPPKAIFRRHGQGPGFGRDPGAGRFDERGPVPPDQAQGPPLPPAREFREPPFPVDFVHTTNPNYYWAAVHVPVVTHTGDRPEDLRLVWRFASLWTNSFFFDYRPWLAAIIVFVLVSVACWLPLIRSLTQVIARMTKATGQIAEGHFEIQLPVKRSDELGRLSDSINRMAKSLSGYVNGQRRFLGDIAHELCAPVARIQMSLGILEQRAPENARRYVETIDEEVQHMSTLVNELLSFSKASIGAAAALESVNVLEVVNRAVDREKNEQATVGVNVPPALAATAQPDYLFRSVSNVLRNAIRYAGADGPIEISARQVGNFAVINVADNGPGVPPAELTEILKPFYRPEAARTRDTGGVGLGLAIVRTCMEACNGTATCRNRTPKGFEVELRLPLANPVH